MVAVLGRNPATGKAYPADLPIDVPGGVAGYDGSASNTDAIVQEVLAQTTDAIRYNIATYDNAATGARFEIDCSATGPYGGQPLRASLFTGTQRTDVFFDYLMLTPASFATGYGINNDGWIPI